MRADKAQQWRRTTRPGIVGNPVGAVHKTGLMHGRREKTKNGLAGWSWSRLAVPGRVLRGSL